MAKFNPVRVQHRPCSEECRKRHLQAFADSFVKKLRRSRFAHAVIEVPEKFSSVSSKLPDWLEPARCEELSPAVLFTEEIERRLGSGEGMYIADSGTCWLATPAEALTAAVESGSDGILSLEEGRLAVVFHHEGRAWLCTADSARRHADDAHGHGR
jgi:hypothetical protein